jgi:hypothetical protein
VARPTTRRADLRTKSVWIASIAAVAGAAASAALAIWPARPVRAPRAADGRAAAESPARAAAATEDPMTQVSRLAGRQDPAAVSALIDLYGELASRPNALEARKLAFRTLLAYPNMLIGLQAALTAIASDQTPRQRDPMWPDLVQGIAALWDSVTIQHGRDLVMLEERPKPRDVLLESLAEVPPGKLSDSQRATLAADLIDLYPGIKPEQKPAIDRALAALGGSDLVEILARRGLAEESHLRAAVEERRAQETARAALHVARASE